MVAIMKRSKFLISLSGYCPSSGAFAKLENETTIKNMLILATNLFILKP